MRNPTQLSSEQNLRHLFVFLHKQLLNVISFSQQVTFGSTLIPFCGPVDWTNLCIKWQFLTKKLSQWSRSNCLKNVDMLDWLYLQPKLRIFIVQVNIAKLIFTSRVFCIFKKLILRMFAGSFFACPKTEDLMFFLYTCPYPQVGQYKRFTI